MSNSKFTKIIERDGQSYIVSDDVDFENIDLESMVDSFLFNDPETETGHPPPLVTKIPKEHVVKTKKEDLWIECKFKIGKFENTYTGTIKEISRKKKKTKFEILFSRLEAYKFINEVVLTKSKSVILPFESIFLLGYTIFYLDDEREIENNKPLRVKNIFVTNESSGEMPVKIFFDVVIDGVT